jgi:hypothetical protein
MRAYQLVLLISILIFLVGVFAESYSDSQPIMFNVSKFEQVNPNKKFEEEGNNSILIWVIAITLLALGYYVYRYFIK